MGTGLTGSMSVAVNSQYLDAALPVAPANATLLNSVPSDSYSASMSQQWAFGTGAGNARVHFHGTWTVPNGGQTIFDLFGTLLDDFGDVINGAELKGVTIHNLSTTPGDVINAFGDVAAGGTPCMVTLAIGDAQTIGPNGWVALCNPIDGYAIATGVTDTVELSNPGGNNIDCKVYFIIE